MVNDVPDDPRVNSMICVAQSIAEIDDLRPGNSRFSFLDVIGNMARGLTNDFKQPLDGQPKKVIRGKCRLRSYR